MPFDLKLLSPKRLALALFFYVTYRIAYRLVLWPYFLSPLRKVPGPPLGNPISGHFPTILKEAAGVPQRRWLNKYGPVIRAVGPFGIERLVFINPEPLKRILVTDAVDFPRPDFFRHMMGICAGYGLFAADGADHKQMRKAMNPAFSIANLSAQTDMYYDIIEDFMKVLDAEIDAESNPEEGKVLPVYARLNKVTLDIICKTAFGYDANTIHNNEDPLAVAYEELLDLQSGENLANLFLALTIPGMPTFFQSRTAWRLRNFFKRFRATYSVGVTIDSMNRVKACSRAILQERIAEVSTSLSETGTTRQKDLISVMLQARMSENPDGKDIGAYFSDAMMAEHVLTFLLAGHETTASCLAWTLWELANDHKSQSKLRAELQALVKESPRPDFRQLKDSPFLDAVMMESLRLWAPVPATVRKAGRDVYLDGVFVPKDTILYIPILVFNTWKEHWGPDAESFNPERWFNLPDNYNSTFSLLSFTAGPHACIGRLMSIMEMKAVLAMIITRYEFDRLSPDQVPKPTTGVTTKPADHMPLRVRKVLRV